MKKGKLLWLAVIAALVLVPSMGWAQAKAPKAPALSEPSFFIELYTGGGGIAKTSNAIRRADTNALPAGWRLNVNIPGNWDAYALGGLKFGYWFSPYGTYALGGLPDWARYFGFYTDFSYHRLSFANQTGNWQVFNAGGALVANGEVGADSSGNLVTWAFMFAGRYGFLPDSQLPFGRVEAYLAVGPAIFFSDQRLTAALVGTGFRLSPATQSEVNVGLAVETGARYFFNKAISAQVSFKYRYFSPSYSFSGNVPGLANTYRLDLKPDMHLLSGQVGVAYHF
jgi:hypothetical protein